MNENGETVDSSAGVGLKVKVQIIHPEWLLFGDEVGTDMSQKNDGSVGGQLFVTSKGTKGNVKSSHTDGRFTLIGLTAASGDAVMAIMIFTGEELSFEQRMGHDISVNFDESKTINENSGPGKSFPGASSAVKPSLHSYATQKRAQLPLKFSERHLNDLTNLAYTTAPQIANRWHSLTLTTVGSKFHYSDTSTLH